MFIVLVLWTTLLVGPVDICESTVVGGCTVVGRCSTTGLTNIYYFFVKFRTPLLANLSSSVSLFDDMTGVKALFFCYFWIYTSELGFEEVLEKVPVFPNYFYFTFNFSLSLSFYFSLKQTLLIGVSCPVSLSSGVCILRRSYIISPPLMPPAINIWPSSLNAIDVSGSSVQIFFITLSVKLNNSTFARWHLRRKS